MSQENAENAELRKLDEKFMDTEKEDKETEIEVRGKSNVTTSSDSMENFSEVDKNDTLDDDDEVEGPESNVFRNHILLKLIGENADFATLKSVRSLNKLCKKVLTSQLIKKSRITLVAGTKSQEQVEVIKHLKGISDLTINVKLLDESEFGFENEGEMLIEILESLSQNLKSLDLNIWPNDEIPLPSPFIQFPSLSTFTYDMAVEQEKYRQFIQLVYASAPNLTQLVLEYLSPEDLSILLDDDGSRNWALAPNLKSLTLTSPTFSSEDLLPLINFPLTWESLDITVRLDDDGFKNIGRLLEKNKDSLVRLKLQQDGGDRQKLKLPKTFPKLEKLELAIFEDDCKVSSGGGPINYSKTFPALTSLSMDLDYNDYREYWDDSSDSTLPPPPRLWRSLFPPQVFNGLKYLKLSYYGLRHVDEDWAQRMFPNARLEIAYY